MFGLERNLSSFNSSLLFSFFFATLKKPQSTIIITTTTTSTHFHKVHRKVSHLRGRNSTHIHTHTGIMNSKKKKKVFESTLAKMALKPGIKWRNESFSFLSSKKHWIGRSHVTSKRLKRTSKRPCGAKARRRARNLPSTHEFCSPTNSNAFHESEKK